MKRLSALLIGTALVLGSASNSQANNSWDFSYHADDGVLFNGKLTTAENYSASLSQYTITGINGIRTVGGNASATTGLILNPNSPGPVVNATGVFIYDNLLFTTAPTFDYYGLLYTVAGGDLVNVYLDSGSYYDVSANSYGYIFNRIDLGNLSISQAAAVQIEGAATPDGGLTAGMLGAGLLSLGMMRRKLDSNRP